MNQPKNIEEAYKDAEESLPAIIFCIEIFATYKKWISSKVYQILKDSGVLYDYIIPHWWALHTQSNEEVCENIDRALKISILLRNA